jgi:hypothetical protein
MARDSAERPPKMLSGETLGLLRTTLARYVDDEAAANGELRDVLARVTFEARDRDMRAEELVVAFKDVLDSLPNGHTPQEKLRRSRMRERLVTQCIKAYYECD